MVSLPVRERGLKLVVLQVVADDQVSLPVRERGLKQRGTLWPPLSTPVAPRAGAWIEADLQRLTGCDEGSRSPCGSVD